MTPTEMASSVSAAQVRYAAFQCSRRAAEAAADDARKQAASAKLKVDSTRRAAQLKRAEAQSVRERVIALKGDGDRVSRGLAATAEGRRINLLVAQIETAERQAAELDRDAAIDVDRAAIAVRDLANFASTEADAARLGAKQMRHAAQAARAAAEHSLVVMSTGAYELDRDCALAEWKSRDSSAQQLESIARALERDTSAVEVAAQSAARAARATDQLAAGPNGPDGASLAEPGDPLPEDRLLVIAAAISANPVAGARMLQRSIAHLKPAQRYELIRALKPQLAEAARRIQVAAIVGADLARLVNALIEVADLAGPMGARELSLALVSKLDRALPARLGNQLILSTHRGDSGALAAAIAQATGSGPLHDWAQSAVAGALGLATVDRLSKLGLTPSRVQQATREDRRVLMDAAERVEREDLAGAIRRLAGLGLQAREMILMLAAQLPDGAARRLLESHETVGALLMSRAGIAAVEALADGNLELALNVLDRSTGDHPESIRRPGEPCAVP